MTITSFTDSRKSYETTDHDCTCGDWMYRGSRTGKPCKHMIARFVAIEAAKATTFIALRKQYDYRSETQRELRREKYLNFEMSIGVL